MRFLLCTEQALCGDKLAVHAANILRNSWSDALELGMQKQLDIAASVRATAEAEMADNNNSNSSSSSSSSVDTSSSSDSTLSVSSSPATTATAADTTLASSYAATADTAANNDAKTTVTAEAAAAAAVELGVQQLKCATGAEVAFLGTGSAQPSKYRNVSAIYLRLGDAGLNAGKQLFSRNTEHT
jgi:cytoskeletal protein RodZ